MIIISIIIFAVPINAEAEEVGGAISSGIIWSSYVPVNSEGDLITEFAYAAAQASINRGWYERVNINSDIELNTIVTANGACIWIDLKGHTINVSEGGGFVSNSSIAIADSVGGGQIVYHGTGSCFVANNEYQNDNCISIYSGTIKGINREGTLIYGTGDYSVVNVYGGNICDAKYGVYINGSRIGRCVGATISNCTTGFCYANIPNQSAKNNSYYNHGISCYGVLGGSVTDCDTGVKFTDTYHLEMFEEAATVKDCSVGVDVNYSLAFVRGIIDDCDIGLRETKADVNFAGVEIEKCKKGLSIAEDSKCQLNFDYYSNQNHFSRIASCEVGIEVYGSVDCDNTHIINCATGIENKGTVYYTGGSISGGTSIHHGGLYCGIEGDILIDELSPIVIDKDKVLTVESNLTRDNASFVIDTETENKKIGNKLVEFKVEEACTDINVGKFRLLHQGSDNPTYDIDGNAFSGEGNSGSIRQGKIYDGKNLFLPNCLYYSGTYRLYFADNETNLFEGLSVIVSSLNEDYDSMEYYLSGYYGELTRFDVHDIRERFLYSVDDTQIDAGFVNFIGWTRDDAWYAKNAVKYEGDRKEPINSAEDYEYYDDCFSAIMTSDEVLYGAYKAANEVEIQYYANNGSGNYVSEHLMESVDESGNYHFLSKPESFEKTVTKEYYDYNQNAYVPTEVEYTFVGWSYDRDEDVRIKTENEDAFISYNDKLIVPWDSEVNEISSHEFLREILKHPNISLSRDGVIALKLYAVWDEAPRIKAKDMYISPEEIATLTEDLLFEQMKVEITDREDDENGVTTYLGLDEKLSDVELLKKELQNVGEIGGTSVTFEGRDSRCGNGEETSKPVYCTAMIYVATDGELEQKSKVRFIDRENYDKANEVDGGLMENSVWQYQDESRAKSSTGDYNPYLDYKAIINKAFDNLELLEKNDSAGAVFSLNMDYEALKSSKEYVGEYRHGNFGASKENSNPLMGWIGMMSENGSVVEDNLSNNSGRDVEDYTVNYYGDVPEGCSSVLEGNMEADTLKRNDYITKCGYSLNGYKFKGWRVTPSVVSKSGKIYADEQSLYKIPVTYGNTINLYAVWEPISYSIALNKGNGLESKKPKIIELKYDESISIPAVENYFRGSRYSVSFDPDGGKLIGDAKLTSETLFSGWALCEDGVAIYSDEDFVSNLTNVDGSQVTLFAVWNTGMLKSPAAEKAGYVFSGWRTEKGGNGDCIGLGNVCFTPKTDMTLYAHYEPIKYKINYNLNLPEGAFCSVETLADQECIYDAETLICSETPEVDGYIFEGWSRSRALEDDSVELEYQPGDVVLNLASEMDAEVTLFAIWRGKEYTVNFLSAEENGEVLASIKLIYGEEDIIPIDILSDKTCIDENLLFKYWKDSAGKIYSPGQMIKNLTTQDGIDIYAIWENMNDVTMNCDDTLYSPLESIPEPLTEECQIDQQPEPLLHHSEE